MFSPKYVPTPKPSPGPNPIAKPSAMPVATFSPSSAPSASPPPGPRPAAKPPARPVAKSYTVVRLSGLDFLQTLANLCCQIIHSTIICCVLASNHTKERKKEPHLCSSEDKEELCETEGHVVGLCTRLGAGSVPGMTDHSINSSHVELRGSDFILRC